MEKNGTVMDYLRWRGDLPFCRDGFNEVDNLVLCIISYINFHRFDDLKTTDPAKAVALPEVAARLTEEDEQRGLSELAYIPLIRLAAETERFRDVRMFGFTHEWDEAKEMQFDAVSYLLPDDTLFVAFMGTDTSLVGWKEDFNMSFLSAVPAQERRKLRIGGHSKGGNLAAWAAIHIPAGLQKRRLLAAYNNDGPGFSHDMVDSEAYRRVADKLHTYVPESSIVGVLLEHAEDYAVIDSSNRSIMQHEPLSWNVLGSRFIRLGERSQMGKLSDDVLRQWIGSMTPQEREQFSDALFEVLSLSGKARTLDDLRAGGLAGGAALLKQYNGANEEDKKIISEIFRRLAVDVKAELKKAAGQSLKTAEKSLADMKHAITGFAKGDKTDK